MDDDRRDASGTSCRAPAGAAGSRGGAPHRMRRLGPAPEGLRGSPAAGYWTRPYLRFGALVSAAIGCLSLGFATHAGPLWRDEVNSLEMATMPALADIWAAMHFDSFPILPTLALRLWATIGGAATVAGLRAFGFLVGVGVLGAIWCSARLLGRRPPWLSLVLVAGSPLLIWTIESIRPYGPGIAFIVLAIGPVWMVATARGGRRMFVAATTAGTLAVQCLYTDAILLLAICLGGSAVALYRRDWRRIVAVLAIGVVPALSILPYLGHIRTAAGWMAALRQPVSTSEIAELMANAMQLSSQACRSGWHLLLIAAPPVAAILLIAGRRPGIADERRQLALFAIATLATSGLLTIAFLRSASVRPSPWYYAPWMAVSAVLLEAVFDQAIAAGRRAWIARIAAVALLALVAAPTWRALSARQTNVDRVARALERSAREGDRIVVYPWFMGVAFRHYYHGRAPWATLPALSDLRIHRYDLLRSEYLDAPPPIGPILDGMAAVLASGGRIFLVGQLPPRGDPVRTFIDSARDPARPRHRVLVPAPPPRSVNIYESLAVIVIGGRRR